MNSLKIYEISPKIIKVIHGYTFNYDQEICTNLKKEDTKLIPHNPVKGILEEYTQVINGNTIRKFRGTCNYKNLSSNILHTHPVSSYAYPSTEDVMKVLKHYGTIVNSLIATKWGIWVIKNTTSSNIYSENVKDRLFHDIKHYLDQLGNLTKTSESERQISIVKSRDLNENDYIFISKMNKKLENMLNININLYKWDDIKSGMYISNEESE